MTDQFETIIQRAKDDDLWLYYGKIEAELKKRNHLRTRNIISERAEYIALDFYNKTPNMPVLQLAPPGTKFIDAISRYGERYAIKGVRMKTSSSSTFQSDNFSQKRFEYLILVRINENYQPHEIYEASWDVVNEYKYYDKTMKAFNLPIRKKLLEQCNLVYSDEDGSKNIKSHNGN